MASATSSEIKVIVAYPSKHPETGEPLKFNMDYYLSGHLPLIEPLWSPFGLKSWSINKFPDPCPLTGQTPPYLVQTTAVFDSLESLKLAMGSSAEKGQADLVNFSNIMPTIWIGEEVKSNTLKGPESEGVPS